MKALMIMALISASALAQIKMPSTTQLKDYSKDVMNACKEDKSKVKGCESYTDVKLLKTCLMANESQLSEKCKAALKMVK